MQVLGISIPNESLAQGLKVMEGNFQAKDVHEVMEPSIRKFMQEFHPRTRTPVCEVTMRATDQLIRKNKKAGKIAFDKASRIWRTLNRAYGIETSYDEATQFCIEDAQDFENLISKTIQYIENRNKMD